MVGLHILFPTVKGCPEVITNIDFFTVGFHPLQRPKKDKEYCYSHNQREEGRPAKRRERQTAKFVFLAKPGHQRNARQYGSPEDGEEKFKEEGSVGGEAMHAFGSLNHQPFL